MKTPDAIGGTDAQQQEYAAKVRTIRADQLGDAQMGRLVSLAGHPPRKLVGIWPGPRGVYATGSANHVQVRIVVLDWGHLAQTAIAGDTEITIHPEA